MRADGVAAGADPKVNTLAITGGSGVFAGANGSFTSTASAKRVPRWYFRSYERWCASTPRESPLRPGAQKALSDQRASFARSAQRAFLGSSGVHLPPAGATARVAAAIEGTLPRAGPLSRSANSATASTTNVTAKPRRKKCERGRNAAPSGKRAPTTSVQPQTWCTSAERLYSHPCCS